MTHTDKQTTAGETYSSNTKEKQLNGWNRCELGDVILFQRGFDLPHRLRKAGSIPIVSSSGISGSHNKALVQAPGVVTGRYGTIGEVFYIEEPFWPLNTTLYVRDFKEITPEYTYHLLKTIDFASHSGKSGVPGVNRNDVHKEIVHIPVSKQEQTAIANVLSDSDALIDALEQLIAKKQAVKSATMQQLLTGRTRLPAFALRPDGTPKGYKPSELGDIPEDWEVKQIGNVAPLQRGFDLPANMRIDGRYPVVYSNGVVNTHNTYKVNGPGVVTGRSGTLGKVHYVEHDFWPHNTSLWVMKFNNSDIKFIYYLFSFIGFERFASGSGVPTLNRNVAHLFKISIPTLLKEQTAIATILSDMDNELQALTQKLEKARALKQGMMQQLLTGKIRLPLAVGA